MDPTNVKPKGVEQVAHVDPGGGGEADPNPGCRALVALHDVGKPIAIRAGLFIGMKRGDVHRAL